MGLDCRRIGFARLRTPRGHGQDHGQNKYDTDSSKGPWVLGAPQVIAVALHKKLANQGACKHQDKQDQPALRVRVQKAVMVAQHGKDHGQREVRVVHTALLAAFAMNGQ